MNPIHSITTAELARRLNGRLVGDATRVIRGVAALEAAGPEDLSWARDAANVTRAGATGAGAILAPENAVLPAGITAMHVADTDAALSQVLAWFAPPTPTVPAGVHPTAIVDPDAVIDHAAIGPHVFVGPRARIGPGTQLHAGVYIGADAVIGENCTLWPNVVVRERVTLGNRVIIHAGSVLGTDGFGYLFRAGRHQKVPQIGDIVVEDDVEIGSCSVVDRAKCGTTRIGRGTKIDNLVQVAHNVEIGPDCIVAAQCGISGSTTLEHHVVLAGQVGLGDHVRIGAGTQLAAQSGVTSNIEGGHVWRGTPAVPLTQYGRQVALVRRLPEMLAELRELKKRVEQLESPANHRKGG